MTIRENSTLSESEYQVKEKLAAMIERVVDDPSLMPEEWSTFFGGLSVVKAMQIVARLRSRPADEKPEPGSDIEHAPGGFGSLEEKRMLRDYLDCEIEKEVALQEGRMPDYSRCGNLDKPKP